MFPRGGDPEAEAVDVFDGAALLEACTLGGPADNLGAQDEASRIYTDLPASQTALDELDQGQVLPLSQAQGKFLDDDDPKFVALQQVRFQGRLAP